MRLRSLMGAALGLAGFLQAGRAVPKKTASVPPLQARLEASMRGFSVVMGEG